MTFNRHSGALLSTVLIGCVLVLLLIGVSAGSSGAPGAGRGRGTKKVPFPKPHSHDANWIQYHGASADLGRGTGSDCAACHVKNDCIECHNTTAPRDHTNTWRTLSHGFMAAGDRERCLTCHRQDYCVRCHNETAPRSHRGNWSVNHCSSCHLGSGGIPGNNCVVCHKRHPH
ncbi:MAG TPA: hypothetical protein DCO77_06555 [Nitrospiraceae bacterium]|nr:hypothetical protein [Nitrospiraceae bacterium]